jgi:hypothetical protein
MDRNSLLLVLLFALQAGVAAASEPLMIRQLDWLIGDWNYEDKSVSGDYRETGVRRCAYTLNENYILCEMHGETNSHKKRAALMYFNYNHLDKRFEMTALFSDYPRKNLYAIEVFDKGHRLELKNNSWSNDGFTWMNSATIHYDGESRYVWDIRSGHPDAETGEHPVTFRDTVVRID